ncbi:MAG: orotate phosphoribosyltransferase [Planctomycetota bacterium]|nr:MAG: orotate phosphoribosyltransferase [Planctomycetota bacterium]
MSDAPGDDLAARLAHAALLRGEFTLRSGKRSGYYIDKYRFTTDPSLLSQIASRLAAMVQRIEQRSSGGVRVARIAGAELGGVPLATAVSLQLHIPSLFVRSAAKTYGTARRIEGVLEEGDAVVLLEDIATTGGQAVEALQTLKEAGAQPVATLCVVDRLEGAREAVEAQGCAFEAIFTAADLGATQ